MEGLQSKTTKKNKMAKQLHVIHRHTANTLIPASGATDNAKLALGEIAVQHNANDPAIWIKIGNTSASTEYVKFIPAAGLVESIGVDGDPTELKGDVVFSSGETPSETQVTSEVGFEIVSGTVVGHVILDTELDEESLNAVTNSAITATIVEIEETVAAALNDLNDRKADITDLEDIESRVEEIEDQTITGNDPIIATGSILNGVEISHKTYTPPTSTSANTLTNGGNFTVVSKIAEDGYGHVTGATATTFTLPTIATEISATGDSYVDASVSNNTAITVSLKSVADTKEDIATATTTGSVTDAKAVKDYVEDLLTSAVHFKEGTATLPTASTAGDMYVATADIAVPAASSTTGQAVTAETGDFLIAGEDGTWSVIEKNLTGAVTTSSNLTSDAIVVGNGNQNVKVASAVGDATHPIYINASGVPVTANTIHDVTATGTTSAASALTWNTESTLGNVNIDGTDYTFKVKMPENPNTDTATTETGHYTPSVSASTEGVANTFISQIILDSKKHVVDVVTGVPETIEVIDCAATIPVNASGATTLATVAEEDITAKVEMNTLTIAGANGLADGITFDGTTDIEILTLDCGEY